MDAAIVAHTQKNPQILGKLYHGKMHQKSFKSCLLQAFEYNWYPYWLHCISVSWLVITFENTWEVHHQRKLFFAQQNSNVNNLFTKKTRSIIYGRQFKAVQGMLDFDYACRREQGSVACIVDPFGGAPRKDFYWGSKQVFIPSMFNPYLLDNI